MTMTDDKNYTVVTPWGRRGSLSLRQAEQYARTNNETMIHHGFTGEVGARVFYRDGTEVTDTLDLPSTRGAK